VESSLQFSYGNEVLRFERLPRNSCSRRVLIKVLPDLSIQALSPEGVSDKEVILAVKKRASWIHKKREAFREQQLHVRPRRYVSGESHFYLGKRYLLKVLVDPSAKPSVKMTRGQFQVTQTGRDADKTRDLLYDWYRVHAKRVFEQRLQDLSQQALWVEGMPLLKIRRMKTQWGNCSPQGDLTLNLHLIKAPRICIDYVILHELTHHAEHNHSPRFYKLMAQVIPGWRNTKAYLDAQAPAYLNE